MASRSQLLIRCFLLFVVAGSTACGGGGSSAPSPAVSNNAQMTASPNQAITPTPTASPSPTQSPTPVAVSGMAVDLISGTPLSGFNVEIGATPNPNPCITAQTATAEPCGVVSSPFPTVTTAGNGAFTTTIPTAGTYMLTISKDSTYATLHRTVVINGSSLGTLSVTALSADEQAWVLDVNSKRLNVSFPASYPNLVIDEYAEEQARAEVAAIVSGAEPYGDSTEGLYGSIMASEPGDMYGSGRGVSDLIGSAGAYLQANTAWVDNEKPNCANGDWMTCTFSGNTGHYINISAEDDVWIGMAESATSFNDPPYGNEWAYAMLLPADVTSADTSPAARRRK